MECLLIDDCGDDKSISLAEEYVNKNHTSIEFRVVHHEKNKGLSGARNTGIRESNGDYVYFLDSDDKITVDCIEKMVKCITEHPDAQMVCGGAHATNGGFKYMDYEERSSELPYYTNDKNWINWAFLKHEMLSMTAWNKLIKKSLLNQYKLFFIEGIVNEDEIFNFQLAQYLSSVCFVHSNTYIYVVRDNSIMTAGKKIQADRNWLVLFDLMLEHFGDEKQERQVSYMFYHCKMRVTWTEDPVLQRGIKKVLLKLFSHGSFRQKVGLIFSYIAPINKMKRYMDISEKLIGKVEL
jgi:glycosyltransferase involved in cell wall biosynthesis